MSDEYPTAEGRYKRRASDRQYAHRQVANAGWWWSRRSAIRELRELEATDGLDDAAQRWAHELLRTELANAWARASQHAPDWDPRMLGQLTALAEEAAAEAALQAADDDFLRPLLTAAAAEEIARVNVERVRGVVEDPTIYVLRATSSEGETLTVLQHAASGLRARFALDPVDGFGEVFSKPYVIPSIDPAAPDDTGDRWQLYAGRGIGRRLYLAAANLHPFTRWRAGVLSPSAVPLRARLHSAGPYRWAGACDWCLERRIIWRDAEPREFIDHPITPAPPAIQPTLVEV